MDQLQSPIPSRQEQLLKVGPHALDEFDCVVCLRLLYDPVTLSCGHTFCKTCILHASNYSCQCPTCRNSYYFDIQELATSVTVKSIITLFFPEEYKRRREELEEAGILLPELGSFGSSPSSSMVLPLFLLGCVVFPGEVCEFFIFEPRYVLMLQRVMRSSRTFGILNSYTMSRPEISSSWTAALSYSFDHQLMDGQVGTLLYVESVTPVNGGQRFLIKTRAKDRFRVKSHHECDGYFVGILDLVRDSRGETAETELTATPAPQNNPNARESDPNENPAPNSSPGSPQDTQQYQTNAFMSVPEMIQLVRNHVSVSDRPSNRYATQLDRYISDQDYEQASLVLSLLLLRDTASKQRALEMVDTKERVGLLYTQFVRPRQSYKIRSISRRFSLSSNTMDRSTSGNSDSTNNAQGNNNEVGRERSLSHARELMRESCLIQ
mmetsp:Transcript_1240/g.2024  ORF Transcript_1240/g.2024 Transcript_1240/m.2024 type:complete len:436 (-) Transcript_1240:573-1880(-)